MRKWLVSRRRRTWTLFLDARSSGPVAGSPRRFTRIFLFFLAQQNYGQADVKRPRMEAGPGAYGSAAPTPTYTNAGAVVRNTADSRVIPLKKLNPYQNRWTIRARVTSKGDLRTYSNARGEGKVFSFDLCDAEGGEASALIDAGNKRATQSPGLQKAPAMASCWTAQWKRLVRKGRRAIVRLISRPQIRVTAWRETAERFYNEIEAGQVYQISRASLKPARKQYNHLNNDYEITLENTSEVTLCHDDDGIPAISFSVTEIRSLVDMAQGSIVDVVGILESVEPPAEVTRRNTGTSVAKRAITIRDQSNHSVELTLWGALATGDVGLQLEMEAPRHPVVAVKGAR